MCAGYIDYNLGTLPIYCTNPQYFTYSYSIQHIDNNEFLFWHATCITIRMSMLPITALEETPALMAATACAMAAGVAGVMIHGVASHSRNTTSIIALIIVVCTWVAAATASTTLGQAALSDIGLQFALLSFAAMISVMGAVDRVRSPSVIFYALSTTTISVIFIAPLLQSVFHTLTSVQSVYVIMTLASAAHLALVTSLPLSASRFTSDGARRIASASALWPYACCTAFLAIALCVMLWRVKAYSGVNTSFHIYACLVAALTSSLAAAATVRYRLSPSALHQAITAMPSGVLAVGLLSTATPVEVCIIAALAGAAAALTRDALVSLRIDDPSHSVASICIPLIMGILAPAFLNLSMLATHIQWLAATLVSGLMLGFLMRVFCQLTFGLSLSRRACADGLDATYATRGA